ncbi:hypothetical protein L083_2550 [Actinoplanes sp. N902-109]|nr:hypothetical protein L083_2550 [Actinoplanes sp. N902-109]
MADLIPLHEASLTDSHEQARKLAESFVLRPGTAGSTR